MTDKDMIRRGDVTEILLDEGWYGQTMSRVEGLPRAVLAELPEVQALLREERNKALREAAEEADRQYSQGERCNPGYHIRALIQEALHDAAHIAIEERGE